MFCHEQFARLAERKKEIEAKGAQLIAIGNGSAQWAEDFIQAEDVDSRSSSTRHAGATTLLA